MSEWQIAFNIGQLIGIAGVLTFMIKGIRQDLKQITKDFSALQDTHNKRIENLQEKHYKLREEIAGNYLRRDEWLSHHNKLEAKLDKRLDEIERLIRGEQK